VNFNAIYQRLVATTGCTSDGEDVKATKQVLDEVGMPNASTADCQQIRRICHVLSHRAASLVAAGRPIYLLVLVTC